VELVEAHHAPWNEREERFYGAWSDVRRELVAMGADDKTSVSIFTDLLPLAPMAAWQQKLPGLTGSPDTHKLELLAASFCHANVSHCKRCLWLAPVLNMLCSYSPSAGRVD
jgi:hypothetical protein